METKTNACRDYLPEVTEVNRKQGSNALAPGLACARTAPADKRGGGDGRSACRPGAKPLRPDDFKRMKRNSASEDSTPHDRLDTDIRRSFRPDSDPPEPGQAARPTS